MSSEARRWTGLTSFEQLRYAREIIQLEAQALTQLAARLGPDFCRAVEMLVARTGNVIVCGIGKAGLIGQKIAATLASTGTRSQFLHPAEAAHGDLGRVHRDDVVLMLSQSGETAEIVQLLGPLTRWRVPIIAITSRSGSTLGRAAAIVLELGPLKEACPLGLAPSTSTTAMLALGDALALVTSQMRGFGREDFARFHPGGSLGRSLSRVEQQMRPLEQCRMASHDCTIRQVLVEVSRPGRRSGAILLIDARGRLSGIFTDSDLARLFESRRDEALDAPISESMTAPPCTIEVGSVLSDAVEMMAERKISELPVVGPDGEPLGLLDVTDIVGLLPDAA